jgi:hypothetical protein
MVGNRLSLDDKLLNTIIYCFEIRIYFEGHRVQPHLSVGLTSVRQKGGLPGPPPRNPRPRIPRRPGALCKALMPGSSSGPKS